MQGDAIDMAALDAGGRPLAGATLTLEQLRGADFSGIVPLAVLGWPIRHSVSPQMHNAALAELARRDKRFGSWRYYRVEAEPERLGEALDLLALKGFAGVNLTIPHKVLALNHATIREGDGIGHAAGALNTLWRQNGRWTGTNTDGRGLLLGVRERPLFAELRGADVVLLGAGGAARAIAATCLFSGCKSLYIGNRSRERLGELLDLLRVQDEAGLMRGFDLASPATAGLPGSALIINATSLGLKAEDAAPIDLAMFETGTKVFDTTYGRHRSALLRQADALGFPASAGLPMLVHQGAQALAIWTGYEDGGLPPEALARMYAAAREALGLS